MIRVKGFDLRCGGKRRHGRKRPLIEEHEVGGSQLRSDKGTGRPAWGSLFLGPSEGIRPALRRRPPRVAKRPRRFAKSPRVRIPQIQVKTPTSPKGDIGVLVRVKGFEPPASWSQTTRATNCATPGKSTKRRQSSFEREYYTSPHAQTQEGNEAPGEFTFISFDYSGKTWYFKRGTF